MSGISIKSRAKNLDFSVTEYLTHSPASGKLCGILYTTGYYHSNFHHLKFRANISFNIELGN